MDRLTISLETRDSLSILYIYLIPCQLACFERTEGISHSQIPYKYLINFYYCILVEHNPAAIIEPDSFFFFFCSWLKPVHLLHVSYPNNSHVQQFKKRLDSRLKPQKIEECSRIPVRLPHTPIKEMMEPLS